MKKRFYADTAIKSALAACLAFAALAGCARKPEPRKAYAPLAPEGVAVAAVYETKGLADNPMVDFLAEWGANGSAQSIAVLSEIQPELASISLDAAEIKSRRLKALRAFDWLAFTLKKPAFTAEVFKDDDCVIEIPAAAVVYSLAKPMSLDAFLENAKADACAQFDCLGEDTKEEVRKFFDENFSVSDAVIAGCPAQKLAFTGDGGDVTKRISGFEPCYGMFDEALFIVASSPAAFEETVALYDGKAPASSSQDVVSFMAPGAPAQQRLGVFDIQTMLKEFLGDKYESLPGMIGPYFKPIRNLVFSEEVDGEAMALTCAIRADMDEESASALAAQIEGAKGMVGMAVSFAGAQNPELVPVIKIAENLSAKAENGVLTIEIPVTKGQIEAIDFAEITRKSALTAKQLRDADDEDDDVDDEDDGDVDMSDIDD